VPYFFSNSLSVPRSSSMYRGQFAKYMLFAISPLAIVFASSLASPTSPPPVSEPHAAR
jgi:hypothetical protein